MNESYPAFSEGDAWVVSVGNKVYVSSQLENTDAEQDFAFTTASAPSWKGPSSPIHLLSSEEDSGIWLTANGDMKGAYPNDRTTHLRIQLDDEPSRIVWAGEVSSTWESGELVLDMHQVAGATTVEVIP